MVFFRKQLLLADFSPLFISQLNFGSLPLYLNLLAMIRNMWCLGTPCLGDELLVVIPLVVNFFFYSRLFSLLDGSTITACQ